MIREEWRMHSRLFGSTGLLLFPVAILLLSYLTVYSLQFMAVPRSTIITGMQVMMLFLGLNVGTVGFVSRDAIRNLLGETNLLIFSSRTLPVSQARIIATFLVKDMLYYMFLFIIPITVGIVPSLETGYSITGGLLILAASTGTFMLGVSFSLVLASLYNRSKVVLGAFLAGTGYLLFYFRTGILAFTPVGFLHRPTIGNLFFGYMPILLLAYLGIALFRPRSGQKQRRYGDLYSRIRDHVPGGDSLTAKTLLDIHRSSGSIWKLMFSTGILFIFFIVLVTQIGFGDRFLDAPGMSFAVLLSLAAVPVYNWVNRFDQAGDYSTFPVSMDRLFRAKFNAFLILGLPINYFFLVAGSAWYGHTGLTIGVLLLPLLSIYTVGVVAYIGGLEPNRSLLRTRNFLMFAGAVAAVIVPLFIISVFYRSAPDFLGGFALVLGAAAGITGYRAVQMAADRWS
ncbi:MAG: hypothetical protein SVU32_04880 [Candidatus Nanohaloarchaea archaeon]|nr:hypothetical protein [Candidatus Nanohaloarchaea archaeon]